MLTDAKLRALKLSVKAYKVADSGGLFVQVSKVGTLLWRFKYRYNGQEKLLSIGQYPAINLRELLLAEFVDQQRGRARSRWRAWHASVLAEVCLINAEQRKLVGLLTKTGSMSRGEKSGDRLVRSPILDSMSMLAALCQQLLRTAGLGTAKSESDTHGAAEAEAKDRYSNESRNAPHLSLLAGFGSTN